MNVFVSYGEINRIISQKTNCLITICYESRDCFKVTYIHKIKIPFVGEISKDVSVVFSFYEVSLQKIVLLNRTSGIVNVVMDVLITIVVKIMQSLIPSVTSLSNKVSYSDGKLSIKIGEVFELDSLSKKIELNKVAVENDGFNIHTIIK